MVCCRKCPITRNTEITLMVVVVHEVVFVLVLIRATAREVIHLADGCACKTFEEFCCYIHSLMNRTVVISDVIRKNAEKIAF